MTIGHITWLIPPAIMAAALGLSALVVAVLAPLVVKAGPVDIPRERGLHDNPTPTSGGLAIMAACALVLGGLLIAYRPLIPGSWRDGILLFGFAALMGLSGGIDDLVDLPARLRLGFQIGLCLIFAYFYRVTTLNLAPGVVVQVWPPLGLLGSAAWLLLGINAINFVDGSNGLALGAQTLALLVASSLIAVMAATAPLGGYLGVILLICLCAAGAQIGFTPFNLPPRNPDRAKAFQGDAGSLFGGALITGTALVLKAYDVASVWFGGFLLAPLLVDVVLTLIVRLRQRKNVLTPHKEHLYQLWLQYRDPSHGRLAVRVWGLCALSSAIGFCACMTNKVLHTDILFAALVVVVVVYSAGWFILRGRLLRTTKTL